MAGVYFSKTFCVQKWISFYHCVKVVICSFVFQGIFLGYGGWMWLRMVCSCYAECLYMYLFFVVTHVCSKILLFLCCRQLGLVDIFVSKGKIYIYIWQSDLYHIRPIWHPCVDGPRSFKICGPWYVFCSPYTEGTKKGNAKFVLFNNFLLLKYTLPKSL